MVYDCDVLIVGAGPTGMSAALQLHELGLSCVLVDKHIAGLGFSRAILVNRASLSLLEPFGVAEAIRQKGRALRHIAFHDDQQVILQGDYSEDEHHAYMLPQLETEACLLAALNQRGVDVRRGVTFESATADDQGVTSTLYDADRQAITLRSRYLIGADGYHSKVREILGINYPITDLARPIVTLDAQLASDHPLMGEVDIWLKYGGVMASFRIADDVTRLVLSAGITMAQAQSHFKIERVMWQSTFEVHFAIADHYGAGRVWLAGDAVHVHSPMGGRGMNMGIADGVALAQAIHTGDFADYEHTRRSVAQQWVHANQRLTVAIMGNPTRTRWLGQIARRVLPLANRLSGGRLMHSFLEEVAE